MTRKAVVEAMKSEVSHVVLDSGSRGNSGNTWEQLMATELELAPEVAAYVKNDHLGFTIPYVHRGQSHSYVPDFLLRLQPQFDGDVTRTLIVEVSGAQKSPGPTAQKARTARDVWCPAVNSEGRFGRWGYLEVTEMTGVRESLRSAFAALRADDAAVIGDRDAQDFESTGADRRLRDAS